VNNRLSTFIFLAVGAIAVYLAVLLTESFFDNYEVKQAVAIAHDLARQSDDGELRNQILNGSLHQVGSHWELTRSGELREMNGLGLKDENIFIQRDRGNVLIRVNYQRRIRLKPSDQFITLNYSVEKEGVPRPAR
jgi:hypothetical protein